MSKIALILLINIITGREFHRRGAASEKALSSCVTKFNRETTGSIWS